VCRNFASTGNCHHGERCNFSHVVKLYASVEVSDKNKDAKPGYSRGYGANSKVKDNHKVTSVAVWETNGVIKLFTGSHDGKWRLWNTAPPVGGNGATLTKEFEHFVGGPVDTVHVASHYFFCGFEASPTEAPDAKAGMVHSWNLNMAQDPPMELWMSPMAKYAGSGRIRSLWTTSDGRVWSGGSDGMIRQWAFNPRGGPGGKAGFVLIRNMSGHLGAVTGLALMKGVLWSGGMDGTVRLWNVESGDEAHLIPAVKKDSIGNDGLSVGHSGPVTGLLPFEVPNDQGTFVFSSSLDETVRVWNATNGDCVASEKHGQGVTSIALTTDLKGNPLLICGLFYGDIMIRGTVSNPPLCLLLKLSHNFIGVGHEMGPVNDIQPGPQNTFYAVADDGKLTVWQIAGDFGL
jgi:WD40 repeat protein